MPDNDILAVITTTEKRDNVSGGKPIFIVGDLKELERMSSLVARLTLGMVHEIDKGINIIIRH